MYTVRLYTKSSPLYGEIETYQEPQIQEHSSKEGDKRILVKVKYHSYTAGVKCMYYVGIVTKEREVLYGTEAETILTNLPLTSLPIECLSGHHYFTGHRNMPGEKGSIDPEVFSQILGMHIPNWHAICERNWGPSSWRLDLKLMNETLCYCSPDTDAWHPIELLKFQNKNYGSNSKCISQL